MVGTQRSGSNVLREVLGGVASVFAPPSAHLLREFVPIALSYGDLAVHEARVNLARDMLKLVSLNVQEWPRPLPTADAIASNAGSTTVVGLFVAIHDVAATRARATHWVSKCLENVRYLNELAGNDPEFKFIHVLRDGRDVGLSLREAPIGEKDPRIAARRWVNDQAAMRAYAADAGMVFQWRYEAFLASPGETMERLCGFLGVEWDPTALEFHRRESAQTAARKSPLWRNLGSPLMRDNHGKFRTPSVAEYVARFEEVAADELRVWGYEPMYAMKARQLSASEWLEAEAEDRRLVNELRDSADLAIEALHEPYEAFILELRARDSVPDQP